MAIRDDAFAAVEEPHGLDLRVEGFGFQSARFGDDGLLTEVEQGDLCVGCITDIGVAEATAVAHDLVAQPVHPEAPAADVEGVDIVVPDLTSSGLPHPVPVIVESSALRHDERCGASPEVVIASWGDRAFDGTADRAASSIDDALCEADIPEFAFVHVAHGLSQSASGTVLGSGLTDPREFACGFDHATAFDDVVADRFFDVRIFSSLHRPNGGERVPVVGCCDEYDIDGGIVEDAAQVLELGGVGSAEVFDDGGKFIYAVEIGIADVGDGHIWHPSDLLCVLFAADAASDDRCAERVGGRRGDGAGCWCGCVGLAGQRGGCGEEDGAFEEVATGDVHGPFI